MRAAAQDVGLDSEDGMQATQSSSVCQTIIKKQGTRAPGNLGVPDSARTEMLKRWRAEWLKEVTLALQEFGQNRLQYLSHSWTH